MSNIKHIILTRCRFTDNELFQKYFEIMKKTYIPSINSQTNKNFTIGLIVNEKHFDIIRKEFSDDINIIPFKDAKKDYREYVIQNDITIQTRHDCDDLMLPNYIDHIQKLYLDNKTKYDNFILNFQPTKLVILSGDEYTHSRDYSKVCSMFSTLIQKKVNCGIMDVMHDHLTRLTKNVIYIPDNYVKLVLHGNNSLSKLNPNDKLIKKYEKTI
jgi:hypothetical protein